MGFPRILFLLLFACATLFLWLLPTQRNLQVSFLDVGQGDAIFVQGPTGIQMLVDAGPPDISVLRELGSVMPFYDRSLDAIVATHPDQDHIGGIPDVFDRYHVGTFLEPGIPNDTKAAKATDASVLQSGVTDMYARRGMRLILGGGAYADILFPDRDVSKLETNAGSIVMRVVYGKSSFLLTGDSPQVIEKYLVSLDGGKLKSAVLKAGHHGSNTSSAEVFVKTVDPEYGVFSRGCTNRYGHPAQVIIDLFSRLSVRALDTCEGRVVFLSNGLTLQVIQ